MRSSNVSRKKCFFCDSCVGDLHRVLTFELERMVKQCATILEDNILLGKLSVGDMIARDAMYVSYKLPFISVSESEPNILRQ